MSFLASFLASFFRVYFCVALYIPGVFLETVVRRLKISSSMNSKVTELPSTKNFFAYLTRLINAIKMPSNFSGQYLLNYTISPFLKHCGFD